jgi:ABC-type multidrug transport system ATPase subunit
VIRTEGLTKRYGPVRAVEDVGLEVQPGDRYGLLGPNGSGKTTLVRMLLGLVYATSGTIQVLDQPVPRKVREILPYVGAMVEGPGMYPHLSGRTNLMFFDAAGPGAPRKGRKQRVGDVLERVGLGGIDKRPVKAYSLGMRQRLGLASALLRTPKLLILDEPTNGLDPRGIREIRDLLTEVNRAGTTVFLSSHLLAEVEALCTRVGVMDRGHLVVQEELATLQAPTGRVALTTADPDRVVSLLNGGVVHRDGDRLIVRHADAASLNAQLVGDGVRVAEIGAERRTLEQVVLEATTGSSDRVEAL